MEEHETHRKIIREWMKLPNDKRRTEEQVAAFAKGAVQQNEFQRSHRDPYQKVMGWLLPRLDSLIYALHDPISPDFKTRRQTFYFSRITFSS